MTTFRTRLAGLLAANPMINKELRGRMRSGRSVVVMTIYLVLLSLFCLLFYWLISATSQYSNPYDQHIGRDLLYAIVTFETLLVIFLAPAFTVGAISGERERQTFDLLMTTLLKPRSIVAGKMSAALAFLLVLILAVAPLESLAFMFGGVSPEEIAGSLVVLTFAALLYGSVGFFWSSLMRSTVAATVLTYGTLLLFLAGLPFIWVIVMAVVSSTPGGSGFTQTIPFVYGSGLLLSTNPIIAMAISETYVRSGKPLFFFVDTGLLNGQSVFVIHPWLVYCILALIGSLLLLVWSTRFLPPARRRASRAEVRSHSRQGAAAAATAGLPLPPAAMTEAAIYGGPAQPYSVPPGTPPVIAGEPAPPPPREGS
jgi:ABC-2 type transport system permease protein